ncbi:MAG TPA: hypothetical protein PLR25_21810, partial [Planctomycetaceae bacterium]|nr:hypothetical protein [Planctomycetaceae bacterium]
GDDPYEDNDTKIIVDGKTAGATNSPNFGLVGGLKTIDNLMVNDAADWYRFQTSAASTNEHAVQLAFDKSWGDIDLYVYRSDGTTLVGSSTHYSYNGNGALEIVSLNGESSGIFYARVIGKSTAANNPPGIANYSLYVNVPGTGIEILPENATRLEGNSGNTPFTFTVTRTGDLSGPTTVNYAVRGSGASPADAADFGGLLPSGIVSFAANESSKVITINVTGDTQDLSTDGLTVTLSNPSNGTVLNTAAAFGSILNDDTLQTTISLSGNDLLIEDTDGGTTNDTLTISVSGANLIIADPNNILSTFVAGSSGNSTHTVTVPLSAFAGRIIVNALGGNDTIVIANSVTRSATLNGGDGTDSLTFTGTAGNETATLKPGTLDVTGPNYAVHADSVETVRVYGGGGTNDRAYLYDSAGNDAFVATPTSSYLTGTGFYNSA